MGVKWKGFWTFERVVSLLASLAIISIFIVMPYTVGYFSLVGFYALGFFSVGDFYQFSILQVVVGTLIFSIYYYVPYSNVIESLTDKLNYISFSVLKLKRRQIFKEKFDKRYPNEQLMGGVIKRIYYTYFVFSQDRRNGIIMLWSTLAVVIFAAIFVPSPPIFSFFGVMLTPALVSVNKSIGMRSPVFFVSIFLAMEVFLFLHGRDNAMKSVLEPKNVRVFNSRRNFSGSVYFVGGSSILIIEEWSGGLILIKTDSDAYLFLGQAERVESSCLNILGLEWLRKKAGLRCVNFKSSGYGVY